VKFVVFEQVLPQIKFSEFWSNRTKKSLRTISINPVKMPELQSMNYELKLKVTHHQGKLLVFAHK